MAHHEHDHHDHDHHEHDAMHDCIEKCLNCHAACTMTAQYSLAEGGPQADPEHVGLLLDCAEIAQTSANFMLRGSPFHAGPCAVCAELCRACETACRTFPEDEQLAECADACAQCAEACERMVEMTAEGDGGDEDEEE